MVNPCRLMMRSLHVWAKKKNLILCNTQPSRHDFTFFNPYNNFLFIAISTAWIITFCASVTLVDSEFAENVWFRTKCIWTLFFRLISFIDPYCIHIHIFDFLHCASFMFLRDGKGSHRMCACVCSQHWMWRLDSDVLMVGDLLLYLWACF